MTQPNMEMVCFRNAAGAGKHRKMDMTAFLRYYEPDREYVLNTKKNGFWHYWKSKRFNNRVRIYDILGK